MIIHLCNRSKWPRGQCYDSLMLRNQTGPVAGYVLAGGESRRMGRDKALLEKGGEPVLLERAAIVQAAAGNCTIVAPAGRYEDLGVPVLADRWPGQGPLGGIVTAMEASDAEWNLILAVDMLSVTPEFLAEILAEARRVQTTVVPVHADGGIEPLCGVYHADAFPRLRHFFAAGGRRVKDALREVDVHLIDAPEPLLVNVNTPAQWEAASS